MNHIYFIKFCIRRKYIRFIRIVIELVFEFVASVICCVSRMIRDGFSGWIHLTSQNQTEWCCYLFFLLLLLPLLFFFFHLNIRDKTRIEYCHTVIEGADDCTEQNCVWLIMAGKGCLELTGRQTEKKGISKTKK